MLKLEFKDRRQPGVWLVESVFTIGSGSKNHLVIDDDSVGEAHAEIRLADGQLYLKDLGSFKGTFVGGQKVVDNFQLRSGDFINVGRVELEISDPKTRPATLGVAKTKSDWSLTAIGGDMQGRTIMIHGSMTFGRSSNCDIIIDGEYMSRRHAELSLKGGGVRIVDLGSSNGTCVNGKKVSEHQLKPGDKISFDKSIFLVAGPVGETAASNFLDDDDEEEATMFRAVAPMPKAPPKIQPVASAPTPHAESNVSAASDRSKGGNGRVIVGIIVVAVVAAVVGYMAVVGR
ncbi:MAG: FHA domain-containing protein [Pseudomonadales bacterium]|nr:FHA domain-containing protein [Pseudomonadales bacterium]